MIIRHGPRALSPIGQGGLGGSSRGFFSVASRCHVLPNRLPHLRQALGGITETPAYFGQILEPPVKNTIIDYGRVIVKTSDLRRCCARAQTDPSTAFCSSLSPRVLRQAGLVHPMENLLGFRSSEILPLPPNVSQLRSSMSPEGSRCSIAH